MSSSLFPRAWLDWRSTSLLHLLGYELHHAMLALPAIERASRRECCIRSSDDNRRKLRVVVAFFARAYSDRGG
jgi:hypothetical protein